MAQLSDAIAVLSGVAAPAVVGKMPPVDEFKIQLLVLLTQIDVSGIEWLRVQ